MTEGPRVVLEVPGAEPLTVSWEPSAVRALGTGSETDAWSLDGDVDWSAIEAIRIVSATFADRSLLLLAALRPAGAEGHGAEAVQGLLARRDGDPAPIERPLISTEYDSEGLVRRAGFELADDPVEIPVRVAADRSDAAVEERDGVRRERAGMTFRLEGRSGAGVYEILRRA